MSAAAQRTAVAGTSALRAAPRRPAPAEAPNRAPLSLVRSMPLRRRAPFAIFCLGALGAALIAVLVLNISVSTGQYQLVQLRGEQMSLAKQNQDLTQRVQNYEAPQNIAARAAQYGMVASTSSGQIDLKTLAVTGQAKAAQKGTGPSAVIAPPAVPGQIAAVPAPTTKDPLEAKAAAAAAAAQKAGAAPASGPTAPKPADAPAAPKPVDAPAPAPKPADTPAPELHGGSIPAPAQKAPGH